MKNTILTILATLASCALSSAAVTFTSIEQTVDGVTTTTTLQDLTGSSGSTQDASGDAVTVGVPYATISFQLDITAAAGSPNPGDASATLQFTVDSSTPYTSPAGFFGTAEGAMGTSGNLEVGSLYVMTVSLTGGAVTPTSTRLGLTVVPEPSSAILIGLGSSLFLISRRRRNP